MTCSGIWNITRRYYFQIPRKLSCYYFFIIEAEKSVTYKRPLFRCGWKNETQASGFVTIFLRQWKKNIDSFIVKPVQTIEANNMK